MWEGHSDVTARGFSVAYPQHVFIVNHASLGGSYYFLALSSLCGDGPTQRLTRNFAMSRAGPNDSFPRTENRGRLRVMGMIRRVISGSPCSQEIFFNPLEGTVMHRFFKKRITLCVLAHVRGGGGGGALCVCVFVCATGVVIHHATEK